MKTVNDLGLRRQERPIKVVQFGEGNFLRAFVDYMIDAANEQGVFDGNIAIVKCVPFGSLERFKKQDNLYTVVLRGKQDGQVVNQARIVTSVAKSLCCYEDHEEYLALARLESLRFVVSNTTEAGIVLDETDSMEGIPSTYPGKLTQFLYERFRAFEGAGDKGLVILPVELIENNGGKLKQCVLALCRCWGLPQEFASWIEDACIFCSTLVDRIVTGYPADEAQTLCQELGYTDELLDVAEPFGLWVIESQRDISGELPLDRAGLPVVFTHDQKPYRERKVRILNGAHTATVLLGWLSGLDIVRQCMADTVIRGFMEKALSEIKPFVKLPQEEVAAFTQAVFERFENPFIRHRVLDISLNSVSKWKARVLPSFREHYGAHGVIPPALTFSFAALLAFYSTDVMEDGVLKASRRDGTAYTVRDDAQVLSFFQRNAGSSGYVRAVAANTAFWGEDLSRYGGFCEAVEKYVAAISQDARAAAEAFLKGEL